MKQIMGARRPLFAALAVVSLSVASPLGMMAAWGAEAPASEAEEVVVVTPAALPQDQLQQEINEAFANSGQGVNDSKVSTQAAAVSTAIRYRWKDHGGREVVYRDDAIEKMRTKHGVNRKPTQRSTQYPDGNRSTADTGTSHVYYATFQKRTCTTIYSGRVDASVRMKTVVDFRKYGGTNETKGIVTSYCEGTTVCPSWVNAAS